MAAAAVSVSAMATADIITVRPIDITGGIITTGVIGIITAATAPITADIITSPAIAVRIIIARPISIIADITAVTIVAIIAAIADGIEVSYGRGAVAVLRL